MKNTLLFLFAALAWSATALCQTPADSAARPRKRVFIAHRGVIFSREEILHRIWSDEVIVLDRTIDVNITRLRRKIGPYGKHIVTRLGYGYGFEE